MAVMETMPAFAQVNCLNKKRQRIERSIYPMIRYQILVEVPSGINMIHVCPSLCTYAMICMHERCLISTHASYSTYICTGVYVYIPTYSDLRV